MIFWGIERGIKMEGIERKKGYLEYASEYLTAHGYNVEEYIKDIYGYPYARYFSDGNGHKGIFQGNKYLWVVKGKGAVASFSKRVVDECAKNQYALGEYTHYNPNKELDPHFYITYNADLIVSGNYPETKFAKYDYQEQRIKYNMVELEQNGFVNHDRMGQRKPSELESMANSLFRQLGWDIYVYFVGNLKQRREIRERMGMDIDYEIKETNAGINLGRKTQSKLNDEIRRVESKEKKLYQLIYTPLEFKTATTDLNSKSAKRLLADLSNIYDLYLYNKPGMSKISLYNFFKKSTGTEDYEIEE